MEQGAKNSPSPVWSRGQGVRYSKRAQGKEHGAQGTWYSGRSEMWAENVPSQ